MPSGLGPLAACTTTGGILGGIAGFFFGGPGGAAVGAKVGAAAGTQTGMLVIADKVVEDAGEKLSAGVDTAGRKVEVIADKTGAAIESVGQSIASASGNTINKVGEVGGRIIENIADMWSKLFLCSYAVKICFDAASHSINNYNMLACKSAIESINCAAVSMTNVSFNSMAVAVGACVVYKAYLICTERKENANVTNK